ncbi:DUF421 domain-containing protein [Bacillus chungangensis]|uniref:Uncharacterized membrane protein YcaP (DUF421 family) n=1 Tax=Bacillus chungangensis TaxID=587633 RepID=A0ABT9WVW2_9BACI|nr:DUF421 domain-containing protein [Bacillus chungangensis]MDQ0177444.1 uncharacterized membrane protein YcaP (DUF421 family) [Bacillus chungangensis]
MSQWIEVIIRSFTLLIILFLLTKWLGKKQFSQLSLFEYVIGITIGSIAAEISTGLESNYYVGVMGLIVWTAIPFFVNLATMKNKKFRDFIEGKASVIIKDGKIQEENLAKEKYTVDDLMELLRKKDAYRVADVEFAILEANGDLNVLLKKEKQPLTPKQLGITVAAEKEPQTVIMEGEIMDEPLAESGYNRQWLEAELEKLNVTVDNVFIGQVDHFGELTVDIYDDQIQVPTPQTRPLLLAVLKKTQADLELFSLQTEVPEAKQMYKKNAEKLAAITDKVMHLLKA